MKSLVIAVLIVISVCHSVVHAQQPIFTMVQMDRFEYQSNEEDWVWDLQGWVGGDLNKFWWKTEGEVDGDDAELQMLYSKAISPYWDLQIGLKHSLEPKPTENSAVIGLQGLAPQWFEVDIAAFLADDGEVEARLEVEYDLLLTQRLILQPRLEVDSEEESTDVSVRLRYEVKREIAPYVGLSWNRSHSQSDEVSVIVGARFWF